MMELRDLVTTYRPTKLEDCVDGKRMKESVDDVFKLFSRPRGYELYI